MKSHYPDVVSYAEAYVPGILAFQARDADIHDTDMRDAGGWLSPERGYAEPGASAAAAATLIALACCPDSRYHGDARLTASARRYVAHLLRSQHDDGTLDLRETNFHDATMVAFCVQNLAYAYRLLERRASDDPDLRAIMSDLESFLKRGGEGMLTGGFHTPNHRWVMASALALLHGVFGDERLRSEAELYLAEGIDCTPAGEYTERSVGIYNATVDRSLIIAAEELGRPELLEFVDRNLTMVLSYMEPDGSLCTLNSRRQDAGKTIYPTAYYDCYVLMAHRTGNGEYAAAAEAILRDLLRDPVSRNGVPVRPAAGDPAALTHYLLRPELRQTDVAAGELPRRYTFENLDSDIVRVRDGNASATILAGKTIFLKYQSGSATLLVRLSATFYGEKGRFTPTAIEPAENGYRLSYARRWGYVRPLDPPPASSDWDAMPHGRRERVNTGDLGISVRVEPGATTRLRIESSGVPDVLWRLELILPSEGFVRTEAMVVPALADGWAIADGPVEYTRGADTIRIRGLRAEHRFAREMRGGEPPVGGAFTLYATGYTPLREDVEISGESFTPGLR
jgi:hypothetical protein